MRTQEYNPFDRTSTNRLGAKGLQSHEHTTIGSLYRGCRKIDGPRPSLPIFSKCKYKTNCSAVYCKQYTLTSSKIPSLMPQMN